MLPVIILFAKAPVSGRVKTRLQPPLNSQQASSLHIAFVHDLIARLQSAGFDLELHTDTGTDVWTDTGVTARLQHEGDLGLKMFHALGDALRRGVPRAMIVGTDAPTIPVEYLEALLASETDVALGPAEDGGYYAISARRVQLEMFGGVTWSASDALQRTIAACAACGLTTEVGPEWWDVDDPVDLERLMRIRDLPPHAAEWRSSNWSD